MITIFSPFGWNLFQFIRTQKQPFKNINTCQAQYLV